MKKQLKKHPGNSAVNHPGHYNRGEIECIDAARAMLTPDEFRGAMKFLTLKYIWREGQKGDAAEDLQKASWYLDRLL